MKKINITPKKKELRKANSTSYDLLQTDPIDINNIGGDYMETDDILSKTLDLSAVTDDLVEENVSLEESTDFIEDDSISEQLEATEDVVEENAEETETDSEENTEEYDIDEFDEFDDDLEESEEEPVKDLEEEFSKTIDGTSSTDIDTMFAIASNTIMEAKNIFSKNHEVKRQIDEKIQELDRLKQEHEVKKQADFQKIKNYKEEVYDKLKLKKEEIAKQLEKLKKAQSEFEATKNEFEEYKKNELDQIRLIKAKQKKFIDEKRNELDSLQHDVTIQRELLEEEKRQLELDRIKYDADKNELSNNLLKFNELVSDFTINIDKFTDEEGKNNSDNNEDNDNE